jgi:hypothetical protein
MASPYVAGSYLVAKGEHPSWAMQDLFTLLGDMGDPVYDYRNGITRPRPQVDRALGLPPPYGTPGDKCGDPLELPEATDVETDLTLGRLEGIAATCDAHASEAINKDLWLEYVAPCDGFVDFELTRPALTGNVYLGLFSGCNTADEITCTIEDCPDWEHRCIWNVPAAVGERFLVRVAGWWNSSLSSMRAVCSPQAGPFCGDGLVNNPGEECDGSDDAACLCSGDCLEDCTCTAPETHCQECSNPGDVNGDGLVNFIDARLILLGQVP